MPTTITHLFHEINGGKPHKTYRESMSFLDFVSAHSEQAKKYPFLFDNENWGLVLALSPTCHLVTLAHEANHEHVKNTFYAAWDSLTAAKEAATMLYGSTLNTPL